MPDTVDRNATDPLEKQPSPGWWTRLFSNVKRKVHERRNKYKNETSADRAVRVTTRATVWMALFTAVLAIVGIATYFVLKNQLREMHEGGNDTHDLAVAAKISAEAAKSAAKTALDTLHISERAYLTIGGPLFDFDKGVVGLPINNGGRIPSGEVEVIIHEATVIQADTKLLPQIKNTVEKYWIRSQFTSIPPGNPINVAMTIQTFSKNQLEAGQQVILLAGRVIYNDGFPDEPRQEWPFCFQSVRHLVMKQTIWTSCNAQTMIPVLEGLDGYPSNERKPN